jgi:hypothetical protein
MLIATQAEAAFQDYGLEPTVFGWARAADHPAEVTHLVGRRRDHPVTRCPSAHRLDADGFSLWPVRRDVAARSVFEFQHLGIGRRNTRGCVASSRYVITVMTDAFSQIDELRTDGGSGTVRASVRGLQVELS